MKYVITILLFAIALVTVLQFASGEWRWPEESHLVAVVTGYPKKQQRGPGTLPKRDAGARQSLPAQSVTAADVIQGTPDRVYATPSMYEHRYVMLDQWKLGWLSKIPSSKYPPNTLPTTIPDCDWYMAFGVSAGACMSSAEVERVRQMGKNTAWGLPYADLLCYVEVARFAEGFLLTHCRAVPIPIDVEVARENQQYREQELQNDLNDLELEVERAERAAQ